MLDKLASMATRLEDDGNVRASERIRSILQDAREGRRDDAIARLEAQAGIMDWFRGAEAQAQKLLQSLRERARAPIYLHSLGTMRLLQRLNSLVGQNPSMRGFLEQMKKAVSGVSQSPVQDMQQAIMGAEQALQGPQQQPEQKPSPRQPAQTQRSDMSDVEREAWNMRVNKGMSTGEVQDALGGRLQQVNQTRWQQLMAKADEFIQARNDVMQMARSGRHTMEQLVEYAKDQWGIHPNLARRFLRYMPEMRLQNKLPRLVRFLMREGQPDMKIAQQIAGRMNLDPQHVLREMMKIPEVVERRKQIVREEMAKTPGKPLRPSRKALREYGIDKDEIDQYVDEMSGETPPQQARPYLGTQPPGAAPVPGRPSQPPEGGPEAPTTPEGVPAGMEEAEEKPVSRQRQSEEFPYPLLQSDNRIKRHLAIAPAIARQEGIISKEATQALREEITKRLADMPKASVAPADQVTPEAIEQEVRRFMSEVLSDEDEVDPEVDARLTDVIAEHVTRMMTRGLALQR